MAKPSKLDREIEEARKEYRRAETDLHVAGRIVAALERAKAASSEASDTPKVKRTRCFSSNWRP